jgi:hypothetical protein
MVSCTQDSTIVHLKGKVWEQNRSQLQDVVDAPQLEVTEDGQDTTKCSWNKQLSDFKNSGSMEQPFIILYERGQGTVSGPNS